METGHRAVKRLVRIDHGRKIAGVCAGFGDYFGVDPVLVRLLWVGSVLCCGTGILLYLLAWIMMPLDTKLSST